MGIIFLQKLVRYRMYSFKNISERNKIDMVPVLNQELMHIIGERGE
jgi:hypothetical protein